MDPEKAINLKVDLNRINIDKELKNTLFDEKIGGTIYCTWKCYPELVVSINSPCRGI